VIRTSALVPLILANALGQTSSVPYASNSDGPGPTFASQMVTVILPGQYSSIRRVDFRNLKPLRYGRYSEDEDGVHYTEQLEKLYYLSTSKSSSLPAALVLYSWFSVGGSSSQGERVQIFSLAGGTLRSTQRIGYPFPGGSANVHI
jgi:hypothetical protein